MTHSCYGRKKVLDLIKRRVAALKEGCRQNLALVGSLHIGKSTIFRKCVADADDNDVVFVYLDLENRDAEYLISKTIRTILYQTLKSRGSAVSEDLAVLAGAALPVIPRTAKAALEIRDMAANGRFEAAFDHLLQLPGILIDETGVFCVLIYDEFQELEGFGIPDIFRKIAAHLTAQQRSLFILSSSYEERARRILDGELRLLFGNFEVAQVEPFDVEAAHEFISARIGQVRMGLQLRNFLADFTGGRPLYLDLITGELVNLSAIHKQEEIYAPLVGQAIENLVFGPWGSLSRHFELLVNRISSGRSSRLMTRVLFALANGARKSSELALEVACGKTALMQRIAVLIDEGMVEKNGTFYFIKDKLLRYWLKYVFQRRIKAIDMDPGRGRKEFRDEVSRAIVEFQANSRRDLPSRIMEVLGEFEDDLLHLHGREYKLPAFTGLRPFKMHHHGGIPFDVIEAQTGEGLWLLVLRKDPLAESDIRSVTDEAKRMGLKPKRCVIVSLSDLDDSARLRALEERMWIWNEPELNSIMNVFDKPCILP